VFLSAEINSYFLSHFSLMFSSFVFCPIMLICLPPHIYFQVEGPVFASCFTPCCESYKIVSKRNLDGNEMIEIKNLLDPSKSEWRKGPALVKLTDPWEELTSIKQCLVLDQDDYIVVKDTKGDKSVIKGPLAYYPRNYGDEVETKTQCVAIPVNTYLIVHDADSTTKPVIHVRGPIGQFYLRAFQTLVPNKYTNKQFWDCVEVTTGKAIHVQRLSGAVELIEEPSFYMPEPGENVVAFVDRVVLSPNDFCVIRCPDGNVKILDGRNPRDRSFFLQPFEEFITFDCDVPLTKMSTLGRLISHKFCVRTSDNVVEELDLRISVFIEDVQHFCNNPIIELHSTIKMHVQNILLDQFAKVSLEYFMDQFNTIAESVIAPTNLFFNPFGVKIYAMQILAFNCTNATTQELLQSQIHVSQRKQNQLKEAENAVKIQVQENEVEIRRKELEISAFQQDCKVALEAKDAENALRMQELEIEIKEEEKRTSLLEIRRGNQLVEAEFEGRALGHAFREQLAGIDPNLSSREKVEAFKKQCDLKQAKLLYAKANKMEVYPKEVDMLTFQMKSKEDADAMKTSYMNGVGFTQGQKSQA